MMTNDWTKKLERLEAELAEAHKNYDNLYEAARTALLFMEKVEAHDWFEDGGAETLPEIDGLRLALNKAVHRERSVTRWNPV